LIFYNSNIIVFSLVDYDLFDFEDFKDFDRRKFKKRLMDNILNDNLNLSILFRRSIIYPIHLRIAIFIILIISDFSISLLFISPDVISNRHQTQKVKIIFL
jgi:hypothetical protein